jgi:hypothetical protein
MVLADHRPTGPENAFPATFALVGEVVRELLAVWLINSTPV